MKNQKNCIRKICSLAAAIAMLGGLYVPANAETGSISATGFEFQTLEGEKMNGFDDATSAIVGVAEVTNNTADVANPYLFMTVTRGGKLVKVAEGTVEVGAGQTEPVYTLLEDDDSFTLMENDVVKAMIWDGIENQTPLDDAISITSTYVTNNVDNYNRETNEIGADRWSYFTNNASNSYKGESNFYLCTGNGNGNWYLDAAGRTDTWVLAPDGSTLAEAGREMAYNYTVGPKAAGKDLKISGTFTGEGTTYLNVIKTMDKDVAAFAPSDIIIDRVFCERAGEMTDGKFEFVIPAEQVEVGNDIMFAISYQVGGFIPNKLNVTIEATAPAEVTETLLVNSAYDYSVGENTLTPGKWSYGAWSAVMDGLRVGLGNPEMLHVSSAGDSYVFSTALEWWNFLTPAGWHADVNRTLATIYTIDDAMAGKELNVKVRMSGVAARGAVLVSEDADAASIGWGSYLYNSAYAKYATYTSVDGDGTISTEGFTDISDDYGYIEVKLPAEKVVAGADVVVLTESQYTYGTKYAPTKTVVQIEASDEKTVTAPIIADSKLDFQLETNVTAPDKWSYYHTTSINDDEGTISIGGPQVVGVGGYEGTWTTDNNNANVVWFQTDSYAKTDGRKISRVYTIGEEMMQASEGINIVAAFSSPSTAATTMHYNIALVNDEDVSKVGTSMTTIASGELTSGAVEIIDQTIPKEAYAKGDDIVLSVWSTGEWWHALYSGMQIKGVGEKLESSYITDTLTDFKVDDNVLTPGEWTYVAYVSKNIDNIYAWDGYAPLKATEGNYVVSTAQTWWNFFNPDGNWCADPTRVLGLVYTVDEEHANKGIKVSGKLGGVIARAAVVASGDADYNSIALAANALDNSYGKFATYTHDENDPYTKDTTGFTDISEDGKFEVIIPASEIKAGTDIIILVESQYEYGIEEGKTQAPTSVYAELTSTNEPAKPVVYADSSIDYNTSVNSTDAGNWSYYGGADLNLETMKLNSVGGLLQKGSGQFEGQWTRDTNNGNHVWYVDRTGWGTDGFKVSFVYTIDEEMVNAAENGIKISVPMVPGASPINYALSFVHDGNATSVGAGDIIKSGTVSGLEVITAEISKDNISVGDDIVISGWFNVEWWVKNYTVMSVVAY